MPEDNDQSTSMKTSTLDAIPVRTEENDENKSKLQKGFEAFHLVQIQEGFQYLYKSRGVSYDHPELDIFECIKFLSFSMGTIAYTT